MINGYVIGVELSLGWAQCQLCSRWRRKKVTAKAQLVNTEGASFWKTFEIWAS